MTPLLLFTLQALVGLSAAAKPPSQSLQTFEALSCSTAYGPSIVKPIARVTKSTTTQITITATSVPGKTTTSTPQPFADSSSSTTVLLPDSKEKRVAAAATKSFPTAIVCTKSVLLVATTTAAAVTSPTPIPATVSYFNLQVRGGSYDGKFAVLDTYGDLTGSYYMAAVDGQDAASPFELDSTGKLLWSNGGGIPWYANQEPSLTQYTDSTVLYFSSQRGGGLDGQPQPTCLIDGTGLLQCTNTLGRSTWETCFSQKPFNKDDGPFIELAASVASGCKGVSLAVVPVQL